MSTPTTDVTPDGAAYSETVQDDLTRLASLTVLEVLAAKQKRRITEEKERVRARALRHMNEVRATHGTGPRFEAYDPSLGHLCHVSLETAKPIYTVADKEALADHIRAAAPSEVDEVFTIRIHTGFGSDAVIDALLEWLTRYDATTVSYQQGTEIRARYLDTLYENCEIVEQDVTDPATGDPVPDPDNPDVNLTEHVLVHKTTGAVLPGVKVAPASTDAPSFSLNSWNPGMKDAIAARLLARYPALDSTPGVDADDAPAPDTQAPSTEAAPAPESDQ
ncbi:MAG TPA: hypothetical protein VFP72_00585 [Kineosporiaceae bacterium]|nr:hypothetical protein [Kineosporiaceae bacterium]